MNIIPVIMCGGAGTRLWPASRESMPKQFIALFSKHSMFQQTMMRVVAEDLFGKPIVVTGADFRFIVAEQLSQIGIDAEIVLEPQRRDSCAAIAVATLLGLGRGGDSVLLALASDHAVTDVEAFREACREAFKAADDGRIVTFGIVPDKPSTAYGYLRPGAAIAGGKVRELTEFVEKPDEAKARQYLDKGYLWNSGNFLFRARTMKAELERLQPALWNAVSASVDSASRDLDFLRLEASAFAKAPRISIDYAVMEHTDRSAVLAVDVGWSDLGSWEAIWAHVPRDDAGNALSGPCEVVGVSNSLVQSDESILTTVVGLEDVVVVTMPDAVLVASRKVGDEMKVLVERLKTANRPQATAHRRIYRPWGFYESINLGDRHQVKRIIVDPGQRLSLQKHFHRSEHWVVVRGTGEITINGEVRALQENESTYIPIAAVHRLSNPGKIPLELIEVQVGSYLGEDDIVRIEDGYNRVP